MTIYTYSPLPDNRIPPIHIPVVYPTPRDAVITPAPLRPITGSTGFLKLCKQNLGIDI